jgi:predicted HAD superfamily Cof-like phosphohydrolase
MVISYINKVKEFMTLFEQPVHESIINIPEDRNKLRIELIFEELKEYAEASGLSDHFADLCYDYHKAYNPDKNQYNVVEQLDALCDLQYVLSGAIIEHGFTNIFDDAFEEVHRSNMSKVSNSKEEALDTCVKYQKESIECTAKEIKGKFITYRDKDNKVLKSINYSPANLKQFINESNS